MKKLVGYFFQGLLYVAPLGLTIYAIVLLFNVIDGLIQRYIESWVKVHIPGLGIVLIFLFITFLGVIGGTILGEPIRRTINKLLDKAPLFKLIYSSIRDLLSAFVGKEKKFNQPVLVKVNTISELEKVGFLTQEDLNNIGIKDKVAVYFPHSYNFSGEMFIVPRENVRPLNMAPADAMKFVVSGGVAMS
jgi:uncharacterized membrane protein